MYCRHCGKAIENDALYCNYCGKKVSDLDAEKSNKESNKTIEQGKCLICGKKFEDGDFKILVESGGSICEKCYSAFKHDRIIDDLMTKGSKLQVQVHKMLKNVKRKGRRIKRKVNKWHFLYAIPIAVLALILVKINSIGGHWYLINAEEVNVYPQISKIFSEPSSEVYFNSNGSFSNTDSGSILGTYSAERGILTLKNPQGGIYTLSYKIRWGKLHLYYGNKECVYSRILKIVAPESVQIAKAVCEDDNRDMVIYNTDIVGKTFITDNSADNAQHRYGVLVQLNDEKSQELEDYTTEHFGHMIKMEPEGSEAWSAEVVTVITNGSVAIFYSDDEAETQEFYKMI